MQNRYVGDMGDFVKFAILRTLAPGQRPGVAWWLFPDEAHNGDGRHVGYLAQRERWRHLDPELFDELRRIVGAGARNVAALEALLPETTYFRDPVPTGGPVSSRDAARQLWFERAEVATRGCDLLFLDPDNGLEPRTFGVRKAKAGKSVSLAELRALRQPGRTLVVYHHHTRMPGGHIEELSHWGRRLHEEGFERIDALRATPYSPRAFFLLEATPALHDRAAALAERWGSWLTWHPELGACADRPQD